MRAIAVIGVGTGPAAQRSPRLAAARARLAVAGTRLAAGGTRLVAIATLVTLTALAGCGAPTHGGAPAAGPAPIADRPITLDGACSQTEDDGFREQAVLKVDANRVDALSWQIWVGKRGTCRFELAEFRQTRWRPSIELLARDGSGCKLMVWQDPRRITLAHAGCERRCTPGVYEEAWPVMFEPGTGRCGTR